MAKDYTAITVQQVLDELDAEIAQLASDAGDAKDALSDLNELVIALQAYSQLGNAAATVEGF